MCTRSVRLKPFTAFAIFLKSQKIQNCNSKRGQHLPQWLCVYDRLLFGAVREQGDLRGYGGSKAAVVECELRQSLCWG